LCDSDRGKGETGVTAPQTILERIDRFQRNLDAYRSRAYNEEQVRVEFINPLSIALGWDVLNEKGYAEATRMWSCRRQARPSAPHRPAGVRVVSLDGGHSPHRGRCDRLINPRCGESRNGPQSPCPEAVCDRDPGRVKGQIDEARTLYQQAWEYDLAAELGVRQQGIGKRGV